MSKKVNLFHFKGDGIEIWVDASFNEGHLLVEGYDIGPVVDRAWGDSDFEYSVTVSRENMQALSDALELEAFNEEDLLNKLKNQFGGNHGFSALVDFLTRQKIKFDYFSYT